eukprot:8026027-Pyramimonas_sp.AAC.1
MLDSQPMGQRLRILLTKVDEVEQKLLKSRKHQEQCRQRLGDAEAALRESELQVKEHESTLGQLKAQQMALAAQGAAQGVEPEARAVGAPMLQLDSDKVKRFLEQGLDQLGVQ